MTIYDKVKICPECGWETLSFIEITTENRKAWFCFNCDKEIEISGGMKCPKGHRMVIHQQRTKTPFWICEICKEMYHVSPEKGLIKIGGWK